MPLFQRKKRESALANSPFLHNTTASTRRNKINNFFTKIVLGLLLFPVIFSSLKHVQLFDSSTPLKGVGYDIKIDFAKAKDNSNSLGPHHISVSIGTRCKNAPFWVRVVGDALLYVTLTEEEPGRWAGSFTLPMEGKYQLESNWLPCDGEGKSESKYQEFEVTESNKSSPTEGNDNDNLFPISAWVTSEKVKIADSETKIENKYQWANLDKVTQGKDMTPLTGANNSIVLKESVVKDESTFYSSFQHVSNYELVCWFGSKSAESIRAAFLALRPQTFGHQRPFKFHYYPSTNFATPDSAWDHDKKGTFRKCKHILISVDELDEPLSQLEYKKQVTTFISHLLKAFDEENTFPAYVWMFTVNEPPIGTKNCHSPYLKKTTDHPCNDVLKDIFKASSFPPRVQLLDNTDISLPGKDQWIDDTFAAIALRIFVIVGKGVKMWRDAGISGGIKGVTTNGVLKPNFDLVPYDFSTLLSK